MKSIQVFTPYYHRIVYRESCQRSRKSGSSMIHRSRLYHNTGMRTRHSWYRALKIQIFSSKKPNMRENHLFEYAVIRVVPHVEREEFLNVGIILFCAKQKFLKTRFELREERLRVLCKEMDFTEVNNYVTSFERICAGGHDARSEERRVG